MARPTWDELRQREREAISVAERATNARITEGKLPPIGKMHLRHGQGPEGARCGECTFLRRFSGDIQIQPFKCVKYRVSHSAATDWRLKWQACGLFEARKTD